MLHSEPDDAGSKLSLLGAAHAAKLLEHWLFGIIVQINFVGQVLSGNQLCGSVKDIQGGCECSGRRCNELMACERTGAIEMILSSSLRRTLLSGKKCIQKFWTSMTSARPR